MELLNVQDGGAFQATAQSFLRATLISYQRLQHSTHHV